MTLKIVVAENDHFARRTIVSVLEARKTNKVVGEAVGGADAIRLARELKPDLVVMDAEMPDVDGPEATRRILAAQPSVLILALSAHSEENWVRAMLEAGARGYVLKEATPETLVEAVATVAAGKFYLSPGITGMVVHEYVRRRNKPDALLINSLTDREREVLCFIGQGVSPKEIADKMGISFQAFYKHRNALMKKLHIATPDELANQFSNYDDVPEKGR